MKMLAYNFDVFTKQLNLNDINDSCYEDIQIVAKTYILQYMTGIQTTVFT